MVNTNVLMLVVVSYYSICLGNSKHMVLLRWSRRLFISMATSHLFTSTGFVNNEVQPPVPLPCMTTLHGRKGNHSSWIGPQDKWLQSLHVVVPCLCIILHTCSESCDGWSGADALPCWTVMFHANKACRPEWYVPCKQGMMQAYLTVYSMQCNMRIPIHRPKHLSLLLIPPWGTVIGPVSCEGYSMQQLQQLGQWLTHHCHTLSVSVWYAGL